MQIYFNSPAGRQIMEMSQQDYDKLPRGSGSGQTEWQQPGRTRTVSGLS